MPPSIVLCPHCHTPVDPASLDTARSPVGEWRICPACDEPLLFQAREPNEMKAPAPAEHDAAERAWAG